MCQQCHPDWPPEKVLLLAQCIGEGQWEDFYRTNPHVLSDGRRSRNFEMQDFHWRRRKEFEEQFRRL